MSLSYGTLYIPVGKVLEHMWRILFGRAYQIHTERHYRIKMTTIYYTHLIQRLYSKLYYTEFGVFTNDHDPPSVVGFWTYLEIYYENEVTRLNYDLNKRFEIHWRLSKLYFMSQQHYFVQTSFFLSSRVTFRYKTDTSACRRDAFGNCRSHLLPMNEPS